MYCVIIQTEMFSLLHRVFGILFYVEKFCITLVFCHTQWHNLKYPNVTLVKIIPSGFLLLNNEHIHMCVEKRLETFDFHFYESYYIEKKKYS